MITVGVSGGIGSGKSTVCAIFQALGAPIYNADNRAKHLMNNDLNLIELIKKSFGEGSYVNGFLNRDFLAKEVFNNGSQIEKLNQLVHPVVKKDFGSWVEKQTFNYVVKEAALLIETGSYEDLSYLVIVDASDSSRIGRVQKRDPFRSVDEIRQIISKQTSNAKRKELADFMIDNDGKELLIPQVISLHQKFIE